MKKQQETIRRGREARKGPTKQVSRAEGPPPESNRESVIRGNSMRLLKRSLRESGTEREAGEDAQAVATAHVSDDGGLCWGRGGGDGGMSQAGELGGGLLRWQRREKCQP